MAQAEGNEPRARDVMQKHVVTVREDLPVSDLCDLFQQEHVHGVPVVDDGAGLIGFVSQEDVLFGLMGHLPSEQDELAQEEPPVPMVRDIMTAPAVSAGEDAHITDVCRLMWQLRIHHLPIVRSGRVTGMISSLDVCRVMAGEALPD